MNFKEMVTLKIEEQRAAMAVLERVKRVKRGRDLTVRERLTLSTHSETVSQLEMVLENLNWLDKYGK